MIKLHVGLSAGSRDRGLLMVLTVLLILVLICEYRLPKSDFAGQGERLRLEKRQKRRNAMIKRKTTETPTLI